MAVKVQIVNSIQQGVRVAIKPLDLPLRSILIRPGESLPNGEFPDVIEESFVVAYTRELARKGYIQIVKAPEQIVTVEFEEAASFGIKGEGPVNVGVKLSTSDLNPLDVETTVEVYDDDAGSGVSGEDYEYTPNPKTVTFNPDDAHGAIKYVSIEPLQGDIDNLVTVSALVFDMPRGNNAGPYTTYNGTTPSAPGGNWGNIVPEKMDAQASRFGVGQFGVLGTYITASPIKGAGVLRILAPGASHSPDVSTGLKYLTKDKWWFGLHFRHGSGNTDANLRNIMRGTAQAEASNIYVQVKSSTGELTLNVAGTKYVTTLTPGAEHVVAAYYDGTKLSYWLNTPTRVDVESGVPVMVSPTTTTAAVSNEISTANHEIDFSAFWSGISDDYGGGADPATHRLNIQEWMNWKTA